MLNGDRLVLQVITNKSRKALKLIIILKTIPMPCLQYPLNAQQPILMLPKIYPQKNYELK